MMANPEQASRFRAHFLITLFSTMAVCSSANAAITLLGVQYQPDNILPEYQCIWKDRDYPTSCGSSVQGENVHVFIRNDGSSPVTVSDVTLSGISLKNSLHVRYDAAKRTAYSIWFPPALPSDQLQALLDAGEPVWYRINPNPIPAGGSGQIIVRLRYAPKPSSSPISVGIISSGGNLTAYIPPEADPPRLANVSFSSDLSKVYLHWRKTGGAAPTTIKMNGQDVTAIATTVGDPTVGFAASTLQLSQPLSPSSLHVFQGFYADGKIASGGARAFVNKFIYSTWATKPVPDNDFPASRAWIDEAVNHGVNAATVQTDGGLADFIGTAQGQQYMASKDYGLIIDSVGKYNCSNPLLWFIRDEPDNADSRVQGGNIGCLAMSAIEEGEMYRGVNPLTPTTINVDGAYRPHNYYTYGQTVDVFMVDPYYQPRLRDTFWYHNPEWIPLYEKATYIHAVTKAAGFACEPNPLHVILYSCRFHDDSGAVFPFPTPESKRIEVYYALASGAKGFSYWWFKGGGGQSQGIGSGGAEADALWKEIGVLGNEIKTVSPLLVNSHPVTLDAQGSTGVWVRSLAVGTDTFILLVVNDQYYNTETACVYTPVPNASVTVTLPSWMQASPTAFEIAGHEIGDVNTQINGNQMVLNLGTIDLTRMIVITKNPQLRAWVQDRYETQVKPGLCTIAPDVCARNGPPKITKQPANTTVCSGAPTSLIVTAVGTGPFTYQWQKNLQNLSDGGHYSGATTDKLNFNPADSNDTADYQCVITNDFGTTISDSARLTAIACDLTCLQNLGFENGFVNGVGSGWTKFTLDGSIVCSDEQTHVRSGAHSQAIYSTGKYNGGGVMQQFSTTPNQPYTVRAWFKCRSNDGADGNMEGLFGVDATGGTNPNSPTVAWSSKPYLYWSQDERTVTAQGNFITLFLLGRATRISKPGYVYFDDILLAPGAPTDDTPQVFGPGSIRWRWIDLGMETGYRVRDTGGTDKSGLLPADTSYWTESSGLLPNTVYARRIHAINDCGESDSSPGQSARTLSPPPETGSIVPSITSPDVDDQIVWTAVGGFGAGKVQYYRYVWDQNPTHEEWTGTETQWSSGTITTVPTASGVWYLHVQGYNASHVANGTFDYEISAGRGVLPDLDDDGDVDLDDFDLFHACVTGPAVEPSVNCKNRDFDGDDDVDLEDFGILQRCYSGDGNPASADCAN